MIRLMPIECNTSLGFFLKGNGLQWPGGTEVSVSTLHNETSASFSRALETRLKITEPFLYIRLLLLPTRG